MIRVIWSKLSMRTKGSTAADGPGRPVCGGGCHVDLVSNGDHMTHRAKNADCKRRQRPEQVITPRQRPLSTASTPCVTPSCHQRRWSGDVSRCVTSSVITVRKSKKEPRPPERSVSLHLPHPESHSSSKRYSCPPIRSFTTLPSQSPSPSSSSSSSCSCSSPPPLQTSAIIGRDPLGWKLRPRSSSTSTGARTNRLSLQIPLPVITPDPKSDAPSASESHDILNQSPSSTTKPPLRPKPPRRHHSDSSAFLASPVTPVVTLEERRALRLHQVTHSDDDVFSEGNQEAVKAMTRRRKIPPPVPEKSSMARQIAQLMADSITRNTMVSSEATEEAEEAVYSRVTKPRRKQEHNKLQATEPELHLETSSTVRFPDREI